MRCVCIVLQKLPAYSCVAHIRPPSTADTSQASSSPPASTPVSPAAPASAPVPALPAIPASCIKHTDTEADNVDVSLV